MAQVLYLYHLLRLNLRNMAKSVSRKQHKMQEMGQKWVAAMCWSWISAFQGKHFATVPKAKLAPLIFQSIAWTKSFTIWDCSGTVVKRTFAILLIFTYIHYMGPRHHYWRRPFFLAIMMQSMIILEIRKLNLHMASPWKLPRIAQPWIAYIWWVYRSGQDPVKCPRSGQKVPHWPFTNQDASVFVWCHMWLGKVSCWLT